MGGRNTPARRRCQQRGSADGYHFGHLGIRKNLSEIWVDKETGGRSVGMRFVDGTEEYMPYDQPLALVKDPEYLLRNQMEQVVAQIREALTRKRISKRYLAVQLGTSDNQIQRLLSPEILNKNLEQLYRLAMLVGLELEWKAKRAA
jgi:hypothetical protein